MTGEDIAAALDCSDYIAGVFDEIETTDSVITLRRDADHAANLFLARRISWDVMVRLLRAVEARGKELGHAL